MTTIPIRVQIREMYGSDRSDVLATEQSARWEWDQWNESQLREFRTPPKRGYVAVPLSGSLVRAYAIVHLKPTSIEIVRLTVHAQFQRHRIGTQLVNFFRDLAALTGRETLETFVRESDLPAEKFLSANDFKCKEIVRRLYEDTGEDGYRFEFREFEPPTGEEPRITRTTRNEENP